MECIHYQFVVKMGEVTLGPLQNLAGKTNKIGIDIWEKGLSVRQAILVNVERVSAVGRTGN